MREETLDGALEEILGGFAPEFEMVRKASGKIGDFDVEKWTPHHFKLRGKTTKYLLKRAAEGLLPRDIIYRSKKGFGTPVGSWLRSGRISPKANSHLLREKLSSHLEGKSDERLFLWCEYVWQQWQIRTPVLKA